MPTPSRIKIWHFLRTAIPADITAGKTQPRDLGQARGILVILQVQYRGTLQEISNTDLAEQTLSTLEKNSEEFPSSIVREGGLSALLNYLDFFSIAVQRTALQAASAACGPSSATASRTRTSASSSLRASVSSALWTRTTTRASRTSRRSSTRELIRAVNGLLLPAGVPLLAANTYTLLVRALATPCTRARRSRSRSSKADIVDTLYQILTGVLPPAGDVAAEQGGASGGGQGLGGGLADMTVMENLAHRPKDQVEETLSLVSEAYAAAAEGLDGVFDHKDYTENSPARMVKAKAKAKRAAARQATHASLAAAMLVVDSLALTPKASSSAAAAAPADESASEPEEGTASALPAPDRLELLRSKPVVVGWFMGLMVLILIDVYERYYTVRVKTLTGLLKAFVPVASFASSILSSKDHPHPRHRCAAARRPPPRQGSCAVQAHLPARGRVHEMEVLSSHSIVSRGVKPPTKDKEPVATAAFSSSSSAKDKEKEKEKETSESPAPPDADADPADAPPPQTLFAASGSGSVPAIPGFKWGEGKSVDNGEERRVHCARTWKWAAGGHARNASLSRSGAGG
ncbi:hypothetical protein B0H14DRAFT_3727621 [Mycena olivaceomarginata]|nr:hypothetical protein B0H14DRAFT_3727621 [Mycena olivaceomarginata]